MTRGRPDFSPTAVDVILRPEWAAKEGKDKNLSAWGTNKASFVAVSGEYTIPTGKTLYLCGVAFVICAYTAAERDYNQIGAITLTEENELVDLAYLGGNGGNSLTFPKPIVLSYGDKLGYYVLNRSNHACNLYITVWGYEV